MNQFISHYEDIFLYMTDSARGVPSIELYSTSGISICEP